MLNYGTRFEDNYNAARKVVAKRILASSVAGCIGYSLNEPSENGALVRLQGYAVGAEVKDGWTFLDVDFRKADTNCSLDIRLESVDRHDRADHTDKQGNEWSVWTLVTKVNWPCHGSSDPATSMARLNLYQQVAMLAAEIQAEFSGKYVMKMSRSADEIQAAKAEHEAQKLKTKVNVFVEGHRKNMRLGKDLSYGAAYFINQEIPAGMYQVELWNNGRVGVGQSKRYTLNVLDRDRGALLTRIG
jgi:hypothetical protein